MSFLWTSLIRLLSETIDKSYINKAIVLMGTTVAAGTCIVYGLRAFFVAFLSFKYTFYVAFSVILIISFIWLFSFNKLVIPLKNTNNINNEKTINQNMMELIFQPTYQKLKLITKKILIIILGKL